MPERVVAEFLEGGLGDDAALDVAFSAALLRAVASGQLRPIVRCYRPRATVAFSRRDTFLEGFTGAGRAAREHGFEPVIRAPGGRAAAYGDGCLVLEQIVPATDSLTGIRDRFARDAQCQADALRQLRIDARVGEVPGEWCPGAFTVNASGRRKLIGAAQRVVRGGWLLSTVVVIDGGARVRRVLGSVYAALQVDWDPATVGAVAEEATGVTVEAVERLLLGVYSERYHLVPARTPQRVLEAARAAVWRHQVAP